jgi:hypothetical protein
MLPEDEINELLDRVTRAALSPQDMEKLKAYMFDPRHTDFVIARMTELGLDQMGSPQLDPIDKYYVDKPVDAARA